MRVRGLELISDPDATRRRRGRLKRYLEGTVLDARAKFICGSGGECRRSHAGIFTPAQLHHVGRHYDLLLGGCPLRILVAGKSYGGSGPGLDRISLSERADMVERSRNRYARGVKDPGEKRNQHMNGTMNALRFIFDLGLLTFDKRDTEFLKLQDRSVHLFQAFTLANFLLCSATDGRTMTDRSTQMMRSNCARHFCRTLEILEPTLVICQGSGPWLAETGFSTSYEAGTIENIEVNATKVPFIYLPHPAAYGDQNWGNGPKSPYLPTVKRLVNRAINAMLQ